MRNYLGLLKSEFDILMSYKVIRACCGRIEDVNLLKNAMKSNCKLQTFNSQIKLLSDLI